MSDWINKIETLDLSLFDAIPSQTTVGDRRSLLAVQRAIARKHNEYVYLEIGSHLGGTIQPYLADHRCKKIYSIDPRPSQQPDDRSPGYIAYYENNSSERMLNMLDSADLGDVAKIECIDLDASKVEPNRIVGRPRIVFIDGEHTKRTVISDFHFCNKIISKDGVILFHDFWIVHPAILDICNQLDQHNCTYRSLKLDDNMFAIFFDENLIISDSYLLLLRKKNKHFWYIFHLKTWLKQSLPGPLLTIIRSLRNVLRKVLKKKQPNKANATDASGAVDL